MADLLLDSPALRVPLDDDGSLFLRWRSGDAVAGRDLVRRHHPKLAVYFRRRFTGDIGDLVQRTWLRLFETQDRLQHEERFGHYCLGIARNVALEEIRRRVRRAPSVDDFPVPSSAASPDELAVRHETQLQLAVALEQLGPEFADVIRLFYYEHRRAPAVGRALGIPENTARSRLRRARLFLRARIER